MNFRFLKAAAACAALCAATSIGAAQILRVNLQQMIERTDDALVGKIIKREVIRIDHPVDGPELYYTHMTVEGRSLVDNDEETVVVTFRGGFIDEDQGVWNSEAPSEDDVKIGNRVVVFYKWVDNMGGDLAANALAGGHGGLFRTVEGRKGTVVLGRGDGYAVSNNIKLSALDHQITTIDRTLREVEANNK